jgi:Cytosol aminopeptidase family, N-terminal domain
MVKKSTIGKFLVLWLLLLMTSVPLSVTGLAQPALAQTQTAAPSDSQAAQPKPAELAISNAPVPTGVLVQSPAETDTELQIICLFESAPQNTLHGSLVETNEKLKGLLDKIRGSSLFRGDLGETLLIIPPVGSLTARKLLIIGLGDSETFTPQRMELVGSIAYRESNRLGVAHPFFAPTILDGGVSKFTTGQVAERFYAGFLRAARTEKALRDAGAAPGQTLQAFSYLAGPAHATDTQQGLERALKNPD